MDSAADRSGDNQQPLDRHLDGRAPPGDTGSGLSQLWPFWKRLVDLAIRRGASRHDAEDLASWTLIRVGVSSTFERRRDDPLALPCGHTHEPVDGRASSRCERACR